MHLLHGVQKTSSTAPALRAGSWALCLHFVLLCSPVWARPEESRRGLPTSGFEIPPLSELPGATCWQDRQPGSQHNSRNSGSRDIGPLSP